MPQNAPIWTEQKIGKICRQLVTVFKLFAPAIERKEVEYSRYLYLYLQHQSSLAFS